MRPAARGVPEEVTRTEDLDEILVGFKAYLEEATTAHAGQAEWDPLLNEQVYTWTVSDSAVRGLLHYILNAAESLRPLDSDAAFPPFPDRKSSEQCPRILRTAQPVALDPAMTISVPEASFTSDGQTQRRRQSSTTTTIFSRDNATEITWQSSLCRLKAAGDPRHSPVGNDVSRLSSCTSSGKTSRGTRDRHALTESPSEAGLSSKPDPSNQNYPGTQQRSSMLVTTRADETAQKGTQEVEEAEQKLSALTRLRKKSVQLGSAIGSFENGDYRNADHKPRRESTIFRLRSALARIEPSRPKQDDAIFGALTGAQPINAVGHYHARRPGPPSNTCSEDGRSHRCVQHQVAETPPG